MAQLFQPRSRLSEQLDFPCSKTHDGVLHIKVEDKGESSSERRSSYSTIAVVGQGGNRSDAAANGGRSSTMLLYIP